MKGITVYRLGSSQLINAPGLVRWAAHGYACDPVGMVKVITAGWRIPPEAAAALLSRRVPHAIEPGEVVVFAVRGDIR